MEQPEDGRTEPRDERAAPVADSKSSPAEGRSRTEVSPRASFALLLGAGMASGLVAGLLVHAVGEPFGLPAEVTAGIGAGGVPAERLPQIAAARAAANYKNTAALLALAGAVLGCGVAAVAGLLSKSTPGAITGAVAGLALGGVCGGAAGFAAVFAGSRLGSLDALDASHVSIVVQILAWAIVGLGVGTACVAATRNVRLAGRYVPATMAAGLLAGLLYLPAVSMLLPGEDTDLTVPESLTARLFWTTVPAVLMGLTVGRAARRGAH